MQTKLCPTEMKSLADRKMAFTISTASVDRDHDTIDPTGWELTNYLRSPVVLWAHDSSAPPIARATSMWTDHRGLNAEVEFPPKGIHPFADQIHDLVKAGFLNATSVGFIPLSSIPNGAGGQKITSAELLEFSIVSVPSNPSALVLQRGLDMQAMKSWFGQDGGHIDWDAIAASAPAFDLASLRSVKADDMDIDPDDVRKAIELTVPALKAGMAAGLKVQAEQATHAVFCRLTGRLD